MTEQVTVRPVLEDAITAAWTAPFAAAWDAAESAVWQDPECVDALYRSWTDIDARAIGWDQRERARAIALADLAGDAITADQRRDLGANPLALVNLTPHPVSVCDDTGDLLRKIMPSGAVARLVERAVPAADVDGCPVWTSAVTGVEGLPEPDGRRYIVSRVVALYVDHPDLLVPFGVIRDARGSVVGCRGLTTLLRQRS